MDIKKPRTEQCLVRGDLTYFERTFDLECTCDSFAEAHSPGGSFAQHLYFLRVGSEHRALRRYANSEHCHASFCECG